MKKRLFFGMLFLLLFLDCFSQEVTRPIISDPTERLYRRLLIQHSKVVAFIENTLLENDLPQWLSNLALIESHFDKEAISPAGAAGIWQFTQEHAQNYGLSSSDRFDVYKSTVVAIRSLKNLYEKYGNWITVIAAYNCGEGCVDRAMKKSNSHQYADFVAFLPQETLNHVNKFIEACRIVGNFENTQNQELFYNSLQVQHQKVVDKQEAMFATTEITSSFNLKILSKELGVSLAEVLQWNPLLEKEMVATGVGKLRLPTDKMPDFLLLRNTILNKSLFE